MKETKKTEKHAIKKTENQTTQNPQEAKKSETQGVGATTDPEMEKPKKKTLQELDLSDDFLFAKVMEDEEICRLVLQKILNVKIKEVKRLESQKSIDVYYEFKSIRLDIYLDDAEGNIYTVEMQKANEYNIPKRARLYHSEEDVYSIQKGMSYNELKKNYVIFICSFDFFKENRHMYSFENICKEDKNISFGDDVYTVVLNTKGTLDDVDDEMKSFLKYVDRSTEEIVVGSKSPLLESIHDRVLHIKSDSLEAVNYMKYQENLEKERKAGFSEGMEKGHRVGLSEGIEKGRSEGLEKGRSEGVESGKMQEKFEAAKKMLERKMPLKDIADITGLPEYKIKEFAE